MASRPAISLLEAADLGLFFLYIALNLAWVCLRSLSIAVDEYVFYEKLELVRRVGNVATILAMLIGLPFTVFLIGSNLLWAVLVTSAVAKLLSRGAMAPRLRGFAARAHGVLPKQHALDRAQRHFRAERYFHLHVPLLRRAFGVRPRRADHYSRSDLSHLPRRQRHL